VWLPSGLRRRAQGRLSTAGDSGLEILISTNTPRERERETHSLLTHSKCESCCCCFSLLHIYTRCKTTLPADSFLGLVLQPAATLCCPFTINLSAAIRVTQVAATRVTSVRKKTAAHALILTAFCYCRCQTCFERLFVFFVVAVNFLGEVDTKHVHLLWLKGAE